MWIHLLNHPYSYVLPITHSVRCPFSKLVTQSLQSVIKQGSFSLMRLIKHPATKPHAGGDERREHFALIFIQPLIDPLLIHSVSQGKDCSARQSTSEPPRQAVTVVGQPVKAAGLKCGKWQPHWPSQIVKKKKTCAWIMARTTKSLYSFSLSR